jgi:peptide deformylase
MSANIDILKNYTPGNNRLKVLRYPEPILLKTAPAIKQFDEKLKTLALSMLDTMYTAPGIGLAAPQIGQSMRMMVLDVDFSREDKTDKNGDKVKVIVDIKPQIFVNPEIIESAGKIKYEEGCLSLPKIFEDVERFATIKLKYHDLNGSEHFLEADELLSICIQHEIDHLNGIVFIDHLSRLKKSFCKKKLMKILKNEKA